jgi:hypothetical protein
MLLIPCPEFRLWFGSELRLLSAPNRDPVQVEIISAISFA